MGVAESHLTVIPQGSSVTFHFHKLAAVISRSLHHKQKTSDTVLPCLYVADPATFLASEFWGPSLSLYHYRINIVNIKIPSLNVFSKTTQSSS